MEKVFMAAVVFYAIYQTTKLISEHLLKRKIIKAGHIEKAQILDPVSLGSEEVNKYPSLKWGLVAFLAGLGLIIIEVLRMVYPDLINYRHSIMPFGIELVFISLGFLIYFFIMNMKKK